MITKQDKEDIKTVLYFILGIPGAFTVGFLMFKTLWETTESDYFLFGMIICVIIGALSIFGAIYRLYNKSRN